MSNLEYLFDLIDFLRYLYKREILAAVLCDCGGIIYKIDRSYYENDYPYSSICGSCGKLFRRSDLCDQPKAYQGEVIREFLFECIVKR